MSKFKREGFCDWSSTICKLHFGEFSAFVSSQKWGKLRNVIDIYTVNWKSFFARSILGFCFCAENNIINDEEADKYISEEWAKRSRRLAYKTAPPDPDIGFEAGNR